MIRSATCAMAFLLLAVTTAPACAQQGDWWSRAREFSSKYYVVKTDLPENEATELAQHMDATCEAYVRAFSNLPVRIKRPAALRLFLFARNEDYMYTLQSRFEVDGTGSWGMCISRGPEIFLVGYKGQHSVQRMKPLLQHEGFHQFARHLFGNIPPWANEGLAEVFERGVMVGDVLVLGAFPAIDQRRLLAAVEEQQIRGFAEFFNIDQRVWNDRVAGNDSSDNYQQAWSIVHFFLFANKGMYRNNFLGFLVTLNNSVDWKSALVSAMGAPNFAVLEAEWLAYMRETTPTDYETHIRRLDFLAAGMLHLREQDQYPEMEDEFEAALREANFEYESKLFGRAVLLRASDESSFTVPLVDSAKLRLLPQKSRLKPPAPAEIVMAVTEPNLFGVAWKKVGRKYEATFTAEVTSSPGGRKVLAALEKLDRDRAKGRKR